VLSVTKTGATEANWVFDGLVSPFGLSPESNTVIGLEVSTVSTRVDDHTVKYFYAGPINVGDGWFWSASPSGWSVTPAMVPPESGVVV
jgi:hypothetical protein